MMRTLLARIQRYFRIRNLLNRKAVLVERADRLIREHSMMSMSGYYAGVPSDKRPKVAEQELKEIVRIEKELDNIGYVPEEAE